MKTAGVRILVGIIFLLCLAGSSPATSVSAAPLAAEVAQVFIPPDGGATEDVVREPGNEEKNAENPLGIKGDAKILKKCLQERRRTFR